MIETKIDSEKQFDVLVAQYNNWLRMIQLSRFNRTFCSFNDEISSMDVFDHIFSLNYYELNHPFYGSNLRTQQKQAIVIAAAYKRLADDLDNIVGGKTTLACVPKDKVKEEKDKAVSMYENIRDMFLEV